MEQVLTLLILSCLHSFVVPDSQGTMLCQFDIQFFLVEDLYVIFFSNAARVSLWILSPSLSGFLEKMN